jgi:two-component system sensor histidine kinase DesK
VLAVFMFTGLAAWATVAVILVASLAIPSLVPGWRANPYDTFQILVAAVAMWGVALLIQRNAQLAAAQEEIARLVRAEERSRFGRDLHDILGHSLTVVAVKAELAGRLARTAPERAEAEIADMEHIAREALADVRAAAAGYREVTVAGELASARTALTAAGIQAHLPAGPAHVPQRKQEIFGWAIREGVTNVVRHSGATHCSIRVASHEIEITDDGSGPVRAAPNGSGYGKSDCDRIGDPLGAESARARLRAGVPGGPVGGHGLAGLRERAAAVGGSVIVGHSAAGGFALRVRVP